MKVIDQPNLEKKESTPNPVSRVADRLKAVREWHSENEAQEWVTDALKKTLNNGYVLLRDVKMEGLDLPIPLILVGPPGLQVIAASALRGVYRARGEIWEKMDNERQAYRPVLPNLVAQTLLMGKALDAYLNRCLIPLPQIEPILVFSSPGIHIDSQRPAVRIVMGDGLNRFIASLGQSRVYLSPEDVRQVAELLAKAYQELEVEPLESEADVFSFSDEKESKRIRIPSHAIAAGEEAVVSRLNRVPFTGRQWRILGLILFVNIALIVAFLLLILLST